MASARSSCETKRVNAGTLLAHVDDRLAEEVDIHIRCGQQHVLDLGRDPAVPDRHLAQGLQRDPVAHGMRQDRDLAHIGVAGDGAQGRFERVARIGVALAVVAIGQDAAARGPGEQHRHHGRSGIVHDLREAEDRIVEAVVEAVDEHQHAALGHGAHRAAEPRRRLGAVDHVRLQGHEIGGRIAGHALRQLHLARLAVRLGRDGHDEFGEGELGPAIAREVFLRIVGGHARGGNQHVDLARTRHRIGHRRKRAARARAGRQSEQHGECRRAGSAVHPAAASTFGISRAAHEPAASVIGQDAPSTQAMPGSAAPGRHSPLFPCACQVRFPRPAAAFHQDG